MERVNYWSRRASRRRFLGSGAALGVGAASIAVVGCGGGDDDDNGPGLSSLATPTPVAGATPTVVDPFAGVKRGGVYKIYSTGDPPTIDPHANLSFLTKGISAYVYSRLFRYKPGPGTVRADVRPTPDLAQSAESSPDGLKWTVKLKPGIKHHNVAPVNGRTVTADDVKYSWARLTDAKNAAGAQVSFVDKVEYPDPLTIVFTLKQPNAVFVDIISDSNLLWIMPFEADGKFDPARTMIGSGPWIFDSYQASVGYKMKKNPEWHEKGFPLLDGVEVAIIPEYANYLAQFRAGNLDALDANAADLSDLQKLKDIQITSFINQGANWLWFDGNDPNAVYNKDERVRQALSMCADRDALTDLTYDNKKLKAAGLETKDGWNNLIGAGWGRFHLDPKSAKAGDGAKYFKYDPAEAKKLLAAAGFTDSKPLEITYQYTANRYGKGFNDAAEAMQGYIAALGSVKTTTDVQDYSSKYITQTFVGNFKGVAFGLETGFAEVGSYPIRLFTDNQFNHARVKDPTLLKLTQDQQLEANDEKRVAIFHEMQRYHATKMWYIPFQVGAGQTWRLHSPAMRNSGSYYTLGYGQPTESMPFFWKA